MILLDKPYVSDYLKNTIVRNRFPVLRTELSEKLFFLVSENDAVEILSETIQPLIYTNSENSINWLINKLQNSDLSERISLFTETSWENLRELNSILESNLSDFIELRK